MIFGNLDFQIIILLIPALVFSLSFHEFAHAWMAYRLGDDTAARLGRLTLNPMAHLDPVGSIALLLMGFGWAKPVPVDSRFLNNPRDDMVKVAAAGPLSNLELENFNGYDLLVFNKIPADYIIDLNIPIIICTGNLRMKTNYKKISQLVYKHNNISVFSTTKSKITNYSHAFDKLPSLPFKSSLMNFQRTLSHIQGSYKYQIVDKPKPHGTI